MTDTNHIEVLQGFAITYDAQSTIGQAFRAAITALSARASAEDAGDFASDTAALAFLRLVGNGNPNIERAVKRLHSSLIARASAGEGGEKRFIYTYRCMACRFEADMCDSAKIALVKCPCGGTMQRKDNDPIASFTAAPQPAQAGASGWGYCEAHGKAATESLVKYACGCSVHESGDGRNTIATPASPATDHCTCPSETRCAGTCPYYQRLHTTPPAHGDGEGALAYATRLANALWRMHYMDEAPEWEACPDLMGVLSQIDNMTTGLTHPTPEAQEARDEHG